jgi:dTDP-4-dehydrorhamnose reductase
MIKVLITGGNGYIAKSLEQAFEGKYEVTSVSRNNFDLTDSNSLGSFFKGKYFDIVIHAAVKGGNRLKEDDFSVVDQNLRMYYNLLSHRSSYGRLIHFGTGAEIHSSDTLYGNSKKIISDSINHNRGFFNIRIFAVFDENELGRRFIKSNLTKYINKLPMEVHFDKFMDFFYMKDLIKVVEYYIENDSPPKQVDCSYRQQESLYSIANFINHLSYHRVKINEQSVKAQDYCGNFKDLGLNYTGLHEGIKQTYKKLLDT